MNPLLRALTTLLCAVLLISCNNPDELPTPTSEENQVLEDTDGLSVMAIASITSVSPASAEIADLITITGRNFGVNQGPNSCVSINGEKGSVYRSWSKTKITLLVPSGGTSTGKIFVSVGGKKSNEIDFTILESSPVVIGGQTWMGYNLNVSTYSDGTPIPQVTDPTEWRNLTSGAWCYYNNDPAMGAIFGKLYNWYAVNDPRGLAPLGWHVPTDGEWKTLSMALGMSQEDADKFGYEYFGTTEGGKMKEEGTSLWWTPNTGGTNVSGLTMLPGGMRSTSVNNDFSGVGVYNGEIYGMGACWWASSSFDDTRAWIRALDRSLASTYRNYLPKSYGFSVRCIRD